MVIQTVRAGYRQTDVGVFPEDWEVRKIERLADVTAGGTPSTFVPEYWNGDIKWMNSGELNLKKIFDVEGRITESGLRNSSTRLLPSECVLIGLAGQGKTRGTVAMNYVELCTNQSIGAILPNDSFVPEYMYYNLDSRYNELRKLSTGEGGRGGLNLTIIRNMLVPLPPTIEEQSAIAEVLSDTDALIESLDKLIEKKKNIKQGAMQELLTGKKRLPGYSGDWEVEKNRKLTEVGAIPEDWSFERFEDVMTGFTSGQTPSRANPEYFKGNIPWITSGELNYNIITDTLEKITPEAVRSTNLKIIPEGTFLFAITGLEAEGTRGRCAITGIEATTNQSCMALYPKEGMLTTRYLFHYYVGYGKRLALKYCQGTKQQSYAGGTARLLPIILPPTVEEQSAIAQVLSDMDAEIEKLEQKRVKYKQLKIGMMQQLLTGRLRLKWKN